MEAAALFERVLRVSLPRLEFRLSSRLKAGAMENMRFPWNKNGMRLTGPMHCRMVQPISPRAAHISRQRCGIVILNHLSGTQ